jgi:ribulose-phosphate 3-epimerase
MDRIPGKISASLMCANLVRLEKDLRELESSGIEYLHFDVMDGSFVPNIMLGAEFIRAVRRASRIPFDIHLMIENPESKIDWFGAAPGDFVSIHTEATKHAQRALQRIRAVGAMPAVALNPATPLNACDYILDDVDMILLMTVNPGYAGQKLVESTIGKIEDLKDYLIQRGQERISIEVDGNVSFENAPRMRQAGADIFVAGSSSLFKDGMGIAETTVKLREAIAG